MSIKSRRLALGVGAALGALALAPGMALAETPSDDTANCVFSGGATVTPPVQVGPNEGSYAFTSVTGTCVINGDPTAHPGTPGENGTVDVKITSNGEYENTACGTGTATSEQWEGVQDPPNPDEHQPNNSPEPLTPAVITATNPANSPEFPVKLDYTIAFAGGVGPLVITGGSHADGNGASGGGVVLISPTTVPPGNPNCTAGFNVVGSASIVLPD